VIRCKNRTFLQADHVSQKAIDMGVDDQWPVRRSRQGPDVGDDVAEASVHVRSSGNSGVRDPGDRPLQPWQAPAE
jgi:hypothetical protein